GRADVHFLLQPRACGTDIESTGEPRWFQSTGAGAPLPMSATRRQDRSMPSIPIMRPKLPSAERLSAYLESIDASRIYSNFGPLARGSEDRLAEHSGPAHGPVASVANATLGLAIALAIQQPPAATLCVMPAWTFVASAHAAVLAGLAPYFA